MDERLHAPAAARNRDPILHVLRRILPQTGTVLEIASGSGEHVLHFAANLPTLTFQPSDPDPAALRSIAAWIAAGTCRNILPPLLLDAAAAIWPIAKADAIICINMIHIAPWSAAQGLFHHAGKILPQGATLTLYGPFRQHGVPWADSNEDFDQSLKARNPEWGVRALETVTALAQTHGLMLTETIPMPSNNLTVSYKKIP